MTLPRRQITFSLRTIFFAVAGCAVGLILGMPLVRLNDDSLLRVALTAGPAALPSWISWRFFDVHGGLLLIAGTSALYGLYFGVLSMRQRWWVYPVLIGFHLACGYLILQLANALDY